MTGAGMGRKKYRRLKPLKKGDDYRRIWRLVDGAVRDAFRSHPDYLPEGRSLKDVRSSIVKRVVGTIKGHVGKPTRGRSGEPPSSSSEGTSGG